MPEIVGDESVGVKYAINGVLSVTYDGMPLLGETPEVRGLWSAAAIWIKEGPGAGKTVAELIVHGESEIDVYESNIARAYSCQRTPDPRRRPRQRGLQQDVRDRPPGRAVGVGPQRAAARRSTSASASWAPSSTRSPAGSARSWYESNARLLDEYGDRVTRREAEWDSRWWSPIINAEHLAHARPRGDDRPDARSRSSTSPARARSTSSSDVAMRQMDVADRPRRLHAAAHPERRLQAGPDDHAPRRRRRSASSPVARTGCPTSKWFADHLPEDGSAQIHDQTNAWTHARPVGSARARHPQQRHERRRLARGIAVRALQARSRSARSRCSPRGSPTSATSAGSCTCRSSRARGCGTSSPRRARRTASSPPGSACTAPPGASRSATAPTAPSSRATSTWSRPAWPGARSRTQDFVGKEAHLRHREEEPAAIMCTLTVDDHTSASGVKRYMLGNEPILTRDGEPLTDRKGRRSYVTSAGAGPSIGKHILMSYLPPEHAVVGRAAGGRVHGRALSGHGRDERLDAGVRPRQRPRPQLSMNILVCVKRVPLTGGKIVLTDDERAISTRHLGFTVSPHEECGAEEAVRLIEQHGGSSTVLTLGPARGRGATARHDGDRDRPRRPPRDRRREEWDPQATAQAIVEAIQQRGRALRPDPVRQRVRRRRQLPGGDPGRAQARPPGRDRRQGRSPPRTDSLRCEQEVPGGRDVYVVPMPAVVTVKEGLNLPRYPSVPGRLRAKRKPLEATSPARPEPKLEMVKLTLPPGSGKQAEILGNGAEAAAAGRRRAARAGAGLMSVLVFVEDPDDELSQQALTFAARLWATMSTRSRSTTATATPRPPGRRRSPRATRSAARRRVVAPGTERGNEVLAHVAARARPADGRQLHVAHARATRRRVTRVRWGGSLLEEARLHGSPALLTVAPHAVAADRTTRRRLEIDRSPPPRRWSRVSERVAGRRPPACRWPTPTWSSRAAAASDRPRVSR